MGISVLPGQPMEPTPWLDQEILTQQIPKWYYFRSVSLQKSLNDIVHGTIKSESTDLKVSIILPPPPAKCA